VDVHHHPERDHRRLDDDQRNRHHYQWDEYPFILLNLAFSAQASYAAPLILMASNRSSQRDRLTLEHDAQETDAILKIQDIQVELLQAIKAETALVKQLVDQTTKAARDAQAG
jgi:uncharacterized membrane protein